MEHIKTYQEEYENLSLLGKGGNAEAFLARHKEFGYICTVRRLLEPVKDEKAEKYQKFINECRRLLLLDSGGHTHIARINKPQLLYHTDNKANMACVEMEYIKGENIYDYMKRSDGFISSKEVVNFVKNIGSALSYCHFDAYEFLADKDIEYTYKLDSDVKGQTFKVKTDLKDGNKLDITPLQEQELISLFRVTHNDIHEGNIIRKCDGNYILIDFGLAAFGHEGARSSINRQGAREYWAPERFDGIFSEQTDIYSFGILAYQMLTNKLPFVYREEDKANSYEGEESQLHRKHADPNISVPAIEPLRKATCEAVGKTWTGKDYPEWLEGVIMKCLEKNPEKRYANGKELYEDIKSHIEKAAKTPSGNNEEIENLKKQNEESFDRISMLTYYNLQLSEDLEKLKESKVKVVEKKVIVEKPVEKIVEKTVIKKVAKTLWVALAVIFFIASISLGSAWFIDYQSNFDKYNVYTNTQLNDKQAEIDKLNNQITSLQQQIAAKGNNSAMQKIINDKDNEIASLKQQLSTSQNGNSNTADLQRQINQLNTDKTSLQNQLATAKSNSGGNTTGLQNQINSLNGKVSSLEQQINQKNASINTKEAEIARLKKALASALGQ
jgi:serine/threonine protein kinase